MVIMEKASTGVSRKVLGNWHRLWAWLFGPIYYAAKGMWGWAFISLITLNGLWLLPLFNRGIVTRWHENNGWRTIQET